MQTKDYEAENDILKRVEGILTVVCFRSRTERLLGWIPLLVSWFRLNTDGAFSAVTGLAKAGDSVVETSGWDSACVVSLILGQDDVVGSYASFIRSIRSLLSQAWQIYKMAGTANELPLGYRFFQEPSHYILQRLFHDRCGIIYPCMIVE
ncbi:conserved hypothetical protein [Ricinus communis]|uniref:Uncharacterized protein n=1 Tax=Ricinus communis TaxID=3988 RepID=B9SY68_RICCO|nr:conserved hypothetical protein [Ricinus communis]